MRVSNLTFYRYGIALVVSLGFYCFLGMLPSRLFDEKYSTIVLDKNNEILGGIASDFGMWHLPTSYNHPTKLETCIMEYEDKRFNYHPGIDPLAILRALKSNITQRKKVSGGSTITMQLARLIYKDNPRNIFYKIKEALLALRLELAYSKREIISMYLSHAPYGGNIVGYEAASLKYFGHPASELSWAEAAALAVLPNQPAMIFPGKNEKIFKQKRNFLLQKLYQNKKISLEDLALALDEPLPQKAIRFPSLSPHLLALIKKQNPQGGVFKTTLDKKLQSQVMQILESDRGVLEANKVHNACVLVVDNISSEVKAYVGNLPQSKQSPEVDIVQSVRSYGSLLKPFLYYESIREGLILPDALLPDYPTNFGNFVPKNFSQKYSGASPASEALYRSYNIPFVHLLHNFGIDRFLYLMRKHGANNLNKSAAHYGLSLVLGGGELTPWELASLYALFPKTLLAFENPHYNFYQNIYWEKPDTQSTTSKMDPAAVWFTAQALKNVVRPDEEQSHEFFYGKQGICWKTGTSFGNRDAWAIGFNKYVTVLVWCGNADGTGRSGHTGVRSAAPILFHIFDILPQGSEFATPYDLMSELNVCKMSGMKAGENCKGHIQSTWLPANARKSPICSFHKTYTISIDKQYRFNEDCISGIYILENYFVMPPKMRYYYQKQRQNELPPLHPSCKVDNGRELEIIYPRPNAEIVIPTLLDGTKGSVIFEAVHRRKNAEVFWFINQEFVKKTISEHIISISPPSGTHHLFLYDELGNTVSSKFEVK